MTWQVVTLILGLCLFAIACFSSLIALAFMRLVAKAYNAETKKESSQTGAKP